ncbi:MAG TPA: energy transducer TonB [Gemmatimonadaceae bacterium]|nr:energy transducer TonB [Gemmatimonadaceae bacterium]
MLSVLLESRATPSRHLGGTILSTLVHGGLIAVVIALTLPGRDDARRTPDIGPTPVHYVRTTPPPAGAPPSASPARSAPDRSAPPPNLPVIDVPVVTPTHIPPVDLGQPKLTSDQVLLGHRSSALSGSGDPGIAVAGAGVVSDASAVDRVPRIVGRASAPRYPAPLRSAGIEGRVLAEFVVDTLGRVELTTLRFPELTAPLFGDAVRDALARYRFLPGEVAGRKVRTRVAVPFEFRLEK